MPLSNPESHLFRLYILLQHPIFFMWLHILGGTIRDQFKRGYRFFSRFHIGEATDPLDHLYIPLFFYEIHVYILNLSYDGVFKTPSYDGGGGLKVSPLFLFVKTIEKVIRLSTVLIFFLSGGCEDRDILWAFFTNLSIDL
mgnify:CR=1 FL=1